METRGKYFFKMKKKKKKKIEKPRNLEQLMIYFDRDEKEEENILSYFLYIYI